MKVQPKRLKLHKFFPRGVNTHREGIFFFEGLHFGNGVQDSEYETLADSDQDSIYTSGVEDFLEGAPPDDGLTQEPKSTTRLSPSLTSTLVQNILQEDSRAGVAVVDLFVAVKTAKDNLDFLAKCNNEVFDKISNLSRESRIFKEQYGVFLGSMKRFLDKMNADAQVWDLLMQGVPKQRAALLSRPNEEGKKGKGVVCQKKQNGEVDMRRRATSDGETEGERRNSGNRCQTCGSKNTRACSGCGSGRGTAKDWCLGCLLSKFKERSVGLPPVASEAFLGSFMASLFWLQKEQEDTHPRSETSSPVRSPLREDKGVLRMRESTMEMISDIWETFKGVCEEPMLKEPARDCATKLKGESCVSRFESRYEESSSVSRGQNSFSKGWGTVPPNKTNSEESLQSAMSDGESEFEEALTHPSTHFDLRPKSSVTCMGDLTKEVSRRKKSVAALTSNIDVVPTWLEKLATEIISKLTKQNSKSNVKVMEQPYEKPDVSSGKLSDYCEFTIAANTPMGVFDVTVVQYKKSRLSGEQLCKKVPASPDSDSKAPLVSQTTQRLKEDNSSWSEDSLRNDELDAPSDSAADESELEEFVEIFLENPKKKNNEQSGKSSPHYEKGFSKKEELKSSKPRFFEIQKCRPVHFVQEIIQKKQQKVEVEGRTEETEVIPLISGEKKQVVMEGNSSNVVIYIQVEVEDCPAPNSGGIFIEYQKSSHSTQTVEDTNGLPEERTIKLEEKKATHGGVSLFQIWRACENSERGAAEEMAFGEKPQSKLQEVNAAWIDYEEKVVAVRGPKEKSVTFNEELSEIFIERELQETYLEEEINEATMREVKDVCLWNPKQHAIVWLVQNKCLPLQRAEIRRSQQKETIETVEARPAELQTALKLIREIENDIMDVKLGDAILILQRLETELRKHLQRKIKGLGEKKSEKESSLHNYFSAIDFWPEVASSENEGEDSEERLTNLLTMLSDLEAAVKSSECSSNGIELCHYDSSKIYKLLHALTVSIREVEEGADVMSLSQTMEIASQLDTAVREYDSIIRRQPLDYLSSQGASRSHYKSDAEVPVKQYLKNVRKKVFEIVKEEAIDVEERIEEDFDRLDRLERENDEALMFLEAFLQKTERRVIQLADLKIGLKELSSSLASIYESLKEATTRKREAEQVKKEMLTEAGADKEKISTGEAEAERVIRVEEPRDEKGIIHIKEAETRSMASSRTSIGSSVPSIKEPIRETISGLLIALDTLKSRAKKKNEVCREILHSAAAPEKGHELENSSRRSSRSSFTTKHTEVHSTVKEFKKIGQTSLYLAWTKPEGPLSGSVVGYQIHVNGKLNQKVRNPQRVQAILYSVDLTEKAEVQLFAVTEKSAKVLLATVNYEDK